MKRVFQLREDGAGQFLLILEGGLGVITEHGDLDAAHALIRQKQRQIGKQIAVWLRDVQGSILLFPKFHTELFTAAAAASNVSS